MAIVFLKQGTRHLERFTCDLGRDEWIAVAIAADPGAEADECRQVEQREIEAVLLPEGVLDLGVEGGDRVEDRGVIEVERHAYFVADLRALIADVVGLPEGGDLGEYAGLELVVFVFGVRDAIELLKELCDAVPLEHDGAACDFSGVRGEDRGNADPFQKCEGFVGRVAGLTHAAQGALQ